MARNCRKSASGSKRLLLLVSTLILLTLTQAKGSSGGGGSGGGRGGGSSSSSSSGGSRSSSSSSRSSSSSSSSSGAASSKSSTSSGSTSSSSSKAAPAVGSAGAGVKPPSNSYVPRSYTGPVRPAANGAYAPVTPLTASRPLGGAYYALPAYTSSQYIYTRNRPLVHTYPVGYTLLFIPFYSAAYTGNHWAVYNQQGQFWGYDDGDITNGDYDYDDGDGLPSGCQLSTSQAASSAGVLNLASANGSTPAPAPGSANRSASAQQPRQLLCKPLAAAQAQAQGFWTKGHIVLVAVVCSIAGIILLVVLACCLPACCSGCCDCWDCCYDCLDCCERRLKPKPQTNAGKVHQTQPSVWDGATKPHQVEQVMDSNCRV
ncbi:hypothetical protein COCOBI_18-0930 [Coccomyxa sp. Obi]|nr:hypothetical protein COCOBI_18-0930 [Coccomyxa sp. Obi]